MKNGTPSRTAFNVCNIRAHESRKSIENRICYDPLANEFARAFIQQFDNPKLPECLSRQVGKITSWLNYTFKFPSLHTSIVCRCRYIDEVLANELQNGLEQLVILGAGFDTRAYRFPELITEGVVTFEVDFPATQQFKLEILENISPQRRDHVRYIAHDFNKGNLKEKLTQLGFNPRAKNLFIWEGVSMYLPAESVEKIFSFVVRNSRHQSRILFDYFSPLILEIPQKDRELKYLSGYVQQLGESFCFCADYDRISAMARHAGLKIVENLDSQSCRERFFPNSQRSFCEAFLFANAEVIKNSIGGKNVPA